MPIDSARLHGSRILPGFVLYMAVRKTENTRSIVIAAWIHEEGWNHTDPEHRPADTVGIDVRQDKRLTRRGRT